jgi:hypothetical protein
VGAREQISGDLRIALVHQVFIYHSSVVASVAWNVLLSNHVGGTTDPVHRLLTSVTVHVRVNALGGRQFRQLLFVSSQFEHVKFLRTSAAEADLSVDRARSLAEQTILGGNETCVCRQVLAVPTTGFAWDGCKGAMSLPSSV